MTQEQLDALVNYVREVAYVAVNDPTGSTRIEQEAEKRMRAAFESSAEPTREPSVAALRMELAECRALLVDAIADPSPADIKRAADWLANWDGKRIDVGAEAERVELNRGSDA